MKALAALLILALAGCQTAPPPFNPKDAVRVIEFDAASRSCSATYVGPSTLLTASHCFRAGDKLVSINGTIAGIVHIEHDGADHALVKVTTPAPVWAEVGPELRQGEDFEFFGNPLDMRDQYRRGYVTGVKADKVMLDARLWLGDSGAGLFRNGRVVGVVSGVYGHQIFYFGYAHRLVFTPEQWEAAR
ncbi:MAG TPA: trypsin-like peptidase domain-containing protein [Pseudoxanthomonas sp.]|nr:trypsin-like peptidase domain-containing protein [Pseudoxanthomonas sp.]